MTTPAADVAALTERLGRAPQAEFDVVVRDASGAPVVVRNVPFTRDGTPMPTRYWLVDPDLNVRVARIEAAGGVRAAQAAVDPVALRDAHAAYAAERDAAVPAVPDPPARASAPTVFSTGAARLIGTSMFSPLQSTC